MPDYTLVDLTARYNLGKLGAANTELQLNVSNLFDKEYVSTCNTYAWCWYGSAAASSPARRHRS